VTISLKEISCGCIENACNRAEERENIIGLIEEENGLTEFCDRNVAVESHGYARGLPLS